MKTKINYKSGLLLSVIALSSSCQVSHATTYEKLESSWYVGGAVGMSRLQPDGHSTWDLTDENDTAKKVYGGVNLGRDFGLEAFWNDFGEAKMKNNKTGADAKVKYRGYGANVVYHVPSYLGPVHPIVKLGVAKMDTKGHGVTVNQKNKLGIMAGVGAEYDLGEGFRIRGEYEYFDKDIDQLSLGLNWRPVTMREHFDKPRGVVERHEPLQPIVIVNNPAPVIQHVQAPPPRPVVRRAPPPKPVVRYKPRPPKPVVRYQPPKPIVVRRPPPKPVRRAPPPKPIVRTVVKHVPVYIDRPAPKPIVKTIIKHAPAVVNKVHVVQQPAPVRRPPPRTIHKTLAGGSHFATNSASLTNAGRGALDRLSSDLLRDKVVIHNIGIIGHTDSVGDPLSNQRLSESRARTVANYLSSRGLNRRIMTVLGRGETQPLATNATHAGRAQNRRVNIVVKGSQTYRR